MPCHLKFRRNLSRCALSYLLQPASEEVPTGNYVGSHSSSLAPRKAPVRKVVARPDVERVRDCLGFLARAERLPAIMSWSLPPSHSDHACEPPV